MKIKALRARLASNQASNQVVVQVQRRQQGRRMVKALVRATRLERFAQAPFESLRGAAAAGVVQVLGAAQGPSPMGPVHPIAKPVLRR